MCVSIAGLYGAGCFFVEKMCHFQIISLYLKIACLPEWANRSSVGPDE